jgi:large subunit ribosomal protein L18
MITKNRTAKHQRLKKHIRLRISGTSERPRLTIFKSQRHIYAQIVDDATGKTLISMSDIAKGNEESFKDLKGQIAIGKKVGQLTAQRARAKNITQVVFDRNGYLYHGVVKAMADGAREGGLKF